MNEILAVLQDWRLHVLALIAFGFSPGFVLRLALMLYPKEDARRAELPGELYALPRYKRPMWVAEQLETALFEGPSERRRARRSASVPPDSAKSAGEETDEHVDGPSVVTVYMDSPAVTAVPDPAFYSDVMKRIASFRMQEAPSWLTAQKLVAAGVDERTVAALLDMAVRDVYAAVGDDVQEDEFLAGVVAWLQEHQPPRHE